MPTFFAGQTDYIEKLNDVDAAAGAAQDDIDAHIADTTGAHAASAIANTPAGGISATTVQAALNELDTEKFAKSGGTISGPVVISHAAADNNSAEVRNTHATGYGLFARGGSSTRYAALFVNYDATVELLNLSGTGNLTLSGSIAAGAAEFAGHVLPSLDNTFDFGGSSRAIKQIYTQNSVIVTSDARLKTARPYETKERAVARRCRDLGIVYQWNDAIADKGADRARLHFGATVQSVIAAFEAEGLDPLRYGVVCYDEWGAEVIKHPAVEAREATLAVPEVWEEVEVDVTIRINGEDRPAKRTVLQLVQPAVPAQPAVQAREAWTETVREAGNRYSLRLDQLAFFIATAGAGA